jgi:hypothetical protein
MQRSSSFASPVAAGSTSGSSAVCAKPARQGASCTKDYTGHKARGRSEDWSPGWTASAFALEERYPMSAARNKCAKRSASKISSACCATKQCVTGAVHYTCLGKKAEHMVACIEALIISCSCCRQLTLLCSRTLNELCV